jgi:hypothetical protein
VGVTPRIGRAMRAAQLLATALIGGLPVCPAVGAECRDLTGEYLFKHYDDLLKPELQAQLGNVFQRWEDRYHVQVPFKSTGDGHVFAAGCKAHNCTIDEAFLGIDEATCKVFVALLENEDYTLVMPAVWPASLDQARQDWMSR